MKVILEPTATIVGYTSFREHPMYDIPDGGGHAERLGAFAAKGCYDSFGHEGRSVADNQRTIIEHKHGSVLEHGHISLFIEGVTRGLTLELNRHRTFAISQRSTRYTKEDDAAIVLEPYFAELFEAGNWQYDKEREGWTSEHLRNTGTFANESEFLLFDFLSTCQYCFSSYSEAVTTLERINPNKLSGFDLRKWARGKARNILPHALETRGTWTNNHRGWRWFIESRSDAHAEPEIRRLATVVLGQLRNFVPVYYEDFHIEEVIDGIPVWKPEYSKV